MYFQVLGPLDVVGSAGQPLPVRRRLLRVVLADLLFHANQPVPVRHLIEHLWGDRPPKSAVANLRNYVSQLRAVLAAGEGTDPSRLAAGADGYVLAVAAAECDAMLFERLAEDGRHAARQRDHARASERFGRALALWRGPVLADLTLPASVRAQADRLDQLRLTVLEDSIDARLALGRQDELLHELAAATAAHPLRERLWAQRMLALDRAGRPGEALAVYRQVSALLVDRLGIEPGPQLERTRRLVLPDPAPDPDAGVPARPAARPPAHSAGAGPAGASADRAGGSPATAEAVPPAQLPADSAAFTGRSAELVAILARAAGPAAATVIEGPAGVGKTALAVHAAHRLAARYPGGQVFLDLSEPAGADPALVLERLLRLLGMPAGRIPAGVTARAAAYRARLLDRRVLVVLDGSAAAGQVRPLLPTPPGCLVLVTSQHRLPDLPGVHRVPLGVLPLPDAVSLFGRLVGPAGERGAEAARVTEVVELCGRLPLAVRSAAAWLRHHPTWTVADLVEALRSQGLDRCLQLGTT
jgi:DNA-binding SARP family transcriptional activator